MKIHMTKKEYKILLELLEMAHWILYAYSNDNEEESDKQTYHNLIQKLYSYAKRFGFNNLIEYDKKLGEYFPTKEFEDTSDACDYIEAFENDAFWEELIERLVQRDLILQEGWERLQDLDMKERFQKEEPIREKYVSEFEEKGLINLFIKE